MLADAVEDPSTFVFGAVEAEAMMVSTEVLLFGIACVAAWRSCAVFWLSSPAVGSSFEEDVFTTEPKSTGFCAVADVAVGLAVEVPSVAELVVFSTIEETC